MAFLTLEKSTAEGSPVQLYEFQRTSGGTDYFWRYNSSDRDLTYSGNLHKASAISDDGVRLSGEAASTEFIVTMPITEDFCEQFRLSGTVPSDTIYLRVRRAHAADIGDLDGAVPTVNEARVTWVGTVNGVAQLDDIKAKVTCAMLAASFRRGGLRYGYSRNCPHILYGAQCTLNAEDFKATGAVDTVDGTQISGTTFDGFPDGDFTGGYIEYDLPSGMVERRMIISHIGANLVLLGFPAGLLAGDTISAFKGCDRIVKTCDTKFNNLLNFGGFPHTPGRNPFDGNPVF